MIWVVEMLLDLNHAILVNMYFIESSLENWVSLQWKTTTTTKVLILKHLHLVSSFT